MRLPVPRPGWNQGRLGGDRYSDHQRRRPRQVALTDLFALAEHVAETVDIGPGTRVFQVDCADGALLLPFHRNGFVVGGIDDDAAAIESALSAMPDGLFQVGMAESLDPAVPWDVVIRRSSAGQPGAGDMRGVLARMFAKATHAIALLDVPEERRQWMLHALTEIGARAIQFEAVKIGESENAGGAFHVFARV